jgi:hypothetical protein
MRSQNLDDEQDYTDPDLLQKALQQLLEQISKRDQKIARIKAESAAALRASAEREASMLNKIAEQDAILLYTQTQLKDRKLQLDEILASRTWKTALFLQKVHSFLIPTNSHRARILHSILAIISLPFKKSEGSKEKS